MECKLMLFIKNDIPYLWDLSNSFSNSFIDFYSCEGFHQAIYQKEWCIKLRIDNGGCHETLNLLHISRCEMLHFVTSYVKQNSRKQTLEDAQYRLEISFKFQIEVVYWISREVLPCRFGKLLHQIYNLLSIFNCTISQKEHLPRMIFD